jgi:hypothetical protein
LEVGKGVGAEGDGDGAATGLGALGRGGDLEEVRIAEGEGAGLFLGDAVVVLELAQADFAAGEEEVLDEFGEERIGGGRGG